MAKISHKQQLFCLEYLKDLNAAAAAVRAGYATKAARQQGYNLLQRDDIQARIQELMGARAARVEFTADDVLRRWITIATGDVTRLTTHRIGACRFCWGEGHEYQWRTDREYLEALKKAQKSLQEDAEADDYPSDAGGYGYDLTRAPCQTCPECNGLGVPYVQFADTGSMTEADKALFEGVEQTKDGLKFKIADRMKALDQIGRHLGMFRERVEHDLSDPLRDLLMQVQGNGLPIRSKDGDA